MKTMRVLSNRYSTSLSSCTTPNFFSPTLQYFFTQIIYFISLCIAIIYQYQCLFSWQPASPFRYPFQPHCSINQPAAILTLSYRIYKIDNTRIINFTVFKYDYSISGFLKKLPAFPITAGSGNLTAADIDHCLEIALILNSFTPIFFSSCFNSTIRNIVM